MPALEWCRKNKIELDKTESLLEFHLHKMRFIQLLQMKMFNEAKSYMFNLRHYSILNGQYEQAVNELMGAFVFAQRDLSKSPYKYLIEDQNQDRSMPNVRRFEAIDPMVFEDPKTGAVYLYAGGSAGSTLRVFELNPDMVTIKREIKVDTPEKFTEGAFIHYKDGLYHFTYSHGRFNKDNYSVYYATSKTPVGPWKFRGNLMQSNDKYK